VTDADRIRRLFGAEISSSRRDVAGDMNAGGSLSPPAPSIIAVGSGKGGVGKSTVALNLAAALVVGGARVGLLDADIHSPDIPLMVGLHRGAPATSWTLSRTGGFDRTALEPIQRYGIQIMSSGFIVAEDQAMSWSADLVGALLNQLIWSTRWGALDYLVIDLPPGTSDIVQAIFRLLPMAAAVIVVTPQDVAHLDNRRMLIALHADGVRVLGGIENMSGLRCPCCDTRLEVFPPVVPERSIWADGLPHLGTVPLSIVGAEGVDGEPVVVNAPDSDRGMALRAAAEAVRAALL
jgi:ATP-binding protein involved in chromosome partitioning